ncbi:Uncharacterised protein [Mycobacteroides abscessus]|nr:Uncharacterised protein [Mycobacteroides abscessus]CPZ98983.1 Uncharacterised protein [Mycobacteroides abscessus]
MRGVGRTPGGVNGTSIGAAGSDEPRLGQHHLRHMDGYVRARMFSGLVQHPLAVDGPAERGVGACQQQPGRKLPRQRPIGPLRGKRLLECLDRLTEKPALGGHYSGHDAGDRPGEKLSGRRELGVLGNPFLGEIQLPGVRQGQHVAVADHRRDEPIGGPLLIVTAPLRNRLELMAATGDRQRKSHPERGELHGLLGCHRIRQHRVCPSKTLVESVLVECDSRIGGVDHRLEDVVPHALMQQRQQLVRTLVLPHRPECDGDTGNAPQHQG